MGIYEYLILSEDDQWDILWEKGQFVTHRFEGIFKFTLYAIDLFFVEVELDRSDKIIRKKVFKYGQDLNNYSPEIKVP